MEAAAARFAALLNAIASSDIAARAYASAPAAAAAVALLYGAFVLVRFARADSDPAAAAAARRMPPDAFAGQVVLIVGASSGIGEALALEMAERGAVLVLAARRMEQLAALAERCRQVGAHDAMALRLDVLAPDSHAAAVAMVLKKFGRVDVLVCNAGRSQRGLAEKTPLSVDREMFDLNVLGTLSITKAVLPSMLARGSGVIAVTSSIAGKTGSPISSTYSATKAAVNGFFAALRMEVSWRGVSVVVACPGPVHSEITQHAFTEEAGKELGSLSEDAASRMPAERCAKLMAGAIWARLPEVWIAKQPILFYTYVAQFMPGLYYTLAPRIGRRRVEALQRGDAGYDSISSVSGLFGGGGAAAKAKAS